jgi:hypothetical protein
MLSWPARSSSSDSGSGHYRLVALDMDGLLQPAGTLHLADVAALRTAHSLGIKIVLVSASPPRGIHRYWAQLGLGTPVIALNGALVYDFPSRHHQLGQTLDPELLRQALQLVRGMAPKAAVGLECGDTWAASRLGTVAQWQIQQSGEWPDHVGTLEPCLDRPVYQMWIDAPAEALTRLETALAKLALAAMQYTDPSRLLLRPPAASRGWALSWLASSLKVAPHEIMAIGNGSGDRSMLQAAAFAVIVSDMLPEVQAEAVGDTPVAQTKGLAEALSQYLQLEEREEHPWALSEP